MFNDLLFTLPAAAFAFGLVLILVMVWVSARKLAASYQEKILDTTNAQLSEMFIFMDAGFLKKASIAATIIIPVTLLAVSRNPLLAIVGAAACLFCPSMIHKHLKEKRRRTLIRQLPDTLDSLVGALRSGLSLQQALGLLSEQLPKPSNQEFSLLVRKLRMGVSVDDGLESLELRVNSLEYTMFTTSVRIAREVGGNLTESLERLAETMRKKLAMEEKITALTSQGKMQGVIVGSMPLVMMLILNEMEHEAMAPLFSTTMGYGVLTVIVMLELAGYVFIRKIVNIDV